MSTPAQSDRGGSSPAEREAFAATTGYAARADELEMRGARVAYAAGLGAGEWESFLTAEESAELRELAAKGYGTWGKERHSEKLTHEAGEKDL